MKKLLNIFCPFCKSSSKPHFYAGNFKMYRCSKCNLTFVHPLPTNKFLSEYYSRFHTTYELGGGYELFEERMTLDFPSKICTIKKYLSQKNISLLDFGCGKGYFIGACIKSRINAEGVDLSKTAIRYGSKIRKLPVYDLNSKFYNSKKSHYDGITFWATIEHTRNPLETLKLINSLLKPGGILFLDTGIGNDWLDRSLPGVNQWYDPPQHLYVFSIESIILLLKKSGFTIIKINKNFERNKFRFFIRLIRSFFVVLGLNFIAKIFRLEKLTNNFKFIRYPLGNLMSIVAKKDI